MVNQQFIRDWHEYVACGLQYVVVVVDGRGTGFKGRKLRNPVKDNLGFYETIDQIAAARWVKLTFPNHLFLPTTLLCFLFFFLCLPPFFQLASLVRGRPGSTEGRRCPAPHAGRLSPCSRALIFSSHAHSITRLSLYRRWRVGDQCRHSATRRSPSIQCTHDS